MLERGAIIMKAVILDKVTKAEDIQISECTVPKVKNGWVLVKVKAFGMNHSEKILRLNEINADYIKKPIIPGIECVGEIADPSNSNFKTGQKVIALMGGMGRSFDGSYAEYALLPTKNVFSINSNLPWEILGAIPETYFTAWGSLFECLKLTASDHLLIRGATCPLGYAVLQIAKAMGCYVTATTHKEEKMTLLKSADEIILDKGNIKTKGVTKVLELVGPKTLCDTLSIVEKGGIVCSTGILGGVFSLNNFDPIKDIPNGVYLTGFFSNYPTQKTIDDIFSFINRHNLSPYIGKIFDFNNIQQACKSLDYGEVNGKIVVRMED